MSAVIRVPLHNRAGQVTAYALLDETDAQWAELPWYLSRPERGYARHKYLALHRVVMGCRPGDGLIVDHINRDRLDNRRANLRLVTPAQSSQNIPGFPGTSHYRGVSWNGRRHKWEVFHKLNGRSIFIGRFTDEDEAAVVAAEWRRVHMPFSTEAPSGS